MIGDWPVGLGILVVAVLWIQIFLDYRRKLGKIMPSVSQVSTRRNEISKEINSGESTLQSIQGSMSSARKELEDLEEKRIELQERLNPLEMVQIAAGRFRMGTNTPGREDENPEHLISLKSYYIDKYEVTNLQYKEFVQVTGHRSPSHWRNNTFPDARLADHPVVNVSWDDAKAYADWVGKRLPTEAEWERAALDDGRNEYAWRGASNAENANFDNPDGKTTPVDRYPNGKSALGIWDMCGNVSEWVADWYDSKYYQMSPETDPSGPDGGHQKTHRGGGYHENRMGIRAKSRHMAMSSVSNDYIGFRCTLDEPEAGEAD
ncbi:MAG: SUMF1/EgtB/PvdO family nonheme iron enzyme [Gemmatimonadetes bacterium]|nr:SUMF1/EgtB/PvdO family nonheme iron enzyme [Gemmatimonadota bacterium]MBT7860773.1 SUMF1/EgtB/PvdO family nonheme iron enzyme [Gemmatimonadota bacterium]